MGCGKEKKDVYSNYLERPRGARLPQEASPAPGEGEGGKYQLTHHRGARGLPHWPRA